MAVVPAKLQQIAAKYADAHQYTLDGISVEYPDWHFNVRPSNTEPLLRLNLEATTAEMMAAKRDEVIALIRS
jgi:phosphomannomutase